MFLFLGSVVKGKWRNLRDNFRREFAKLQNSRSGDAGGASKKPKWAYFDIMLFLRDTIISRSTSGNIAVPGDTEDTNDANENSDDDTHTETYDDSQEGLQGNEEISNENSAFRTPIADKRINEHRSRLQKNKPNKESIQEQLLRIEQKKLETFSKLSSAKSNDNDDSDYHFLMSLLPLMKQLTPLKNMQMRLNIQQLFVNELMNIQPGYGQHTNIPLQTVYVPQVSPCESYTSESTIGSQIEYPPVKTTTGGQYPSAETALMEGPSADNTKQNTALYFHTFR